MPVKKNATNSGSCIVSPWNSVVLILLTLLIIWFFYYIFTMSSNKSPIEKFLDIENYEDNSATCDHTKKPYSLLFFYMDTCPHCIEFKPTWNKFKHSFENSKFHGKVCVGEVSADKEDVLSKYNVHSFPTVLLVTKSKTIPFEGSRTVSELTNFVSQNVS